MPSHKLVQNWERVGANESVVGEKTVTADSEVNADIAIGADDVDTEADLVIDKDNLKSLFIKSTTGVTIKTNSTGAPDDTITLLANEPLIWDSDSPHANPFSADVTKLYISEDDSAAGTVYLRSLIDSTP